MTIDSLELASSFRLSLMQLLTATWDVSFSRK
nr:MAG TPA: hypothetical protein [Caudoviricetes sp.]